MPKKEPVFYKIESPEHGIQDVDLSLTGQTLTLGLTYFGDDTWQTQAIEFQGVGSFEWKAEPVALCWENTFDTIIVAARDDWVERVEVQLKKFNANASVQRYRVYLSNHGSLDIVCASIELR